MTKSDLKKPNLAELIEGIARLEKALARSQIGHWDWNLDNNEVAISPTLQRMLGMPIQESAFSLDTLVSRYHPEDVPALAASIEIVRQGIEPTALEVRYFNEKNEIRWARTLGTLYISSFDKTRRCVGIVTDITEERLAQKAVQESFERFKQVTDSISEVFWLTNVSKSETIYISPGYESIWGRSCESLYKNPMSFVDAIHPDDRERVVSLLPQQAEGLFQVEYRITRPDGSIRNILDRAFPVRDDSGKVYRLAGIAEDITEKRRAEKLIAEQQQKIVASAKMSTLGEMAGGIAHEINNPSSIILGKVRQLKQMISQPEPNLDRVLESLNTVEKMGERITQIVKGLRIFSRKAEQDPFQFTSLTSILEDTLALCNEKFLSNNVTIAINNQVKTPLQCRPTEISQVILNLLSNAFDAVQTETEKKIEVTAMEDDKNIYISIGDSGAGIPSEIKNKIFEPFFTTKDVGLGTGLGLSISKGIIETHRGTLELDLTRKTTTFKISLPKRHY